MYIIYLNLLHEHQVNTMINRERGGIHYERPDGSSALPNVFECYANGGERKNEEPQR